MANEITPPGDPRTEIGGDRYQEGMDVDRVETVDLQVEMARSYLDYAMSVIVGRALPIFVMD